jgi:predicted permease
MALRAALGAPRWRLVRQVLVEALTLFAVGTAVALVVTAQLNAVLRRFIEALPVPLGFALSVDARVLTATLGVGLVTAVATALSPALRVGRALPTGALRAGAGQTAASHGMRSAFLVGQVALSLVLLVCAGLFVRAAQRGARLETGFDVDRLSVATIGLPGERYAAGSALRFFERLSRRLAAAPSVEAATFAALPPIDVARQVMTARVPGFVGEDGDDERPVDVNAVGRDYFATIGLPVLEGRGFEAADQDNARRVAVINRTAARAFWPGVAALGRTLLLDDTEVAVVGVVADSRTIIQDPAPAPLVYVPAGQQPARRMAVVVRSAAGVAALSRLMRSEVAALDPDLPPPNTAPLSDIIELSMLPQRLAGRFAGGLGGLALVLAVCGVYGIVAYAVGCRRRELGIRVALGGAPKGLVFLVMRSGLLLVCIGLLLGLAGIAALTPVLRRFLLDVSPFDPLVLGSAALLLLAISSLASWLPARRAAGIDPVIALRAD